MRSLWFHQRGAILDTVMAQCIKLLLVAMGSHIRVVVGVAADLLATGFMIMCLWLEKALDNVPNVWALLLMWETWIELLDSGFSLAHIWTL